MEARKALISLSCRLLLSLVDELRLLPPEQRGRLATPLALTTVHVADIDNDDSFWAAGVADTLMLALGLRRSACTFSVCWAVRVINIFALCNCWAVRAHYLSCIVLPLTLHVCRCEFCSRRCGRCD